MRLSIFIWLLLFTFPATSQVIITDADKTVNLATTATYLEDPKGQLTFDEITKLAANNSFKPVNKDVISFGLTPSYFWLRSVLINQTDQPIYIKISNNSLTDIEVFERDSLNAGNSFKTGNWQPFEMRPVKSIDYLFPLKAIKGGTAIIYIRVMHLRGTRFPFHAGELKAFYSDDLTSIFIDGIYYGLMLLMILYNLFIFFSLKDISYLYYIAYVIAIALLNASMDGYAFEYLWPKFPAINAYEDIFAAVVGITGILFVTHFLNTRQNAPLFNKTYLVLLVAYLITIIIIAGGYFLIGRDVMEAVTLVSVVCTRANLQGIYRYIVIRHQVKVL